MVGAAMKAEPIAEIPPVAGATAIPAIVAVNAAIAAGLSKATLRT